MAYTQYTLIDLWCMQDLLSRAVYTVGRQACRNKKKRIKHSANSRRVSVAQ